LAKIISIDMCGEINSAVFLPQVRAKSIYFPFYLSIPKYYLYLCSVVIKKGIANENDVCNISVFIVGGVLCQCEHSESTIAQ